MPIKSVADAQVEIALGEIDARTEGLIGEALRAELTKFMSEQSIAVEGKVTVLWAGYFDVADDIAFTDDPGIRILNKTVANNLLASDEFLKRGPIND